MSKSLYLTRLLFVGQVSVLCLIISCAPPPGLEEKPEGSNAQFSESKKHYSFCREYLKNKMWDDAIKNCELAVQESTSYVDAYVGLGLAYRGKREYNKMEETYVKMIEIAPLKGHYALGQLYTEERKYEKALSRYKEALKVDTSYADAWYGIGYVYEKRGDLSTAIKNYKHALKLDPESENIRYSLGKAYIESGEHEKGIAELKILIATYPEDLDIRAALGKAYLSLKDYNKAKQEFSYIIQQSLTDVTNRLNFGITCEGLKDYESAVHIYKEAISIDTTNISSYCHLINLYIKLKDPAKALKYLNKARQINPKSQILYCLFGDIHILSGDKLFNKKEFDASISKYNKAIKEYKLAIQGEEAEWVSYAQKAIKMAKAKIKNAEEEAFWHRK
ncbi:tetratricopeptide repeat protein [candidate division WOR-3 bacterium]|nr:tetratricopeptide repeat protein [candidate division WOR-3 bacterium]